MMKGRKKEILTLVAVAAFSLVVGIGFATIAAEINRDGSSAAEIVNDETVDETARLDDALASVCYLYEKQSSAATGAVQELAGRELTSAEIDQLTITHERAFEEKYPPPASSQQMFVDLFTHCDFGSLTDEQQARILEATKAASGKGDGN